MTVKNDTLKQNLERKSRLNAKVALVLLAAVALLIAIILILSLVKINGAIVAEGELRVIQAKSQIQHPLGGSIKRVLVSNGETVIKEQVLLELDDTAARAQVSELELQQKRHTQEISAIRTWLQTDVNIAPEAVSPQIDKALIDAPELLQIEAKIRRLRADNNRDRKTIENAKAELVALEHEQSLYERHMSATKADIERFSKLAEQGFYESANIRQLEMQLRQNEIQASEAKRTIQRVKATIIETEATIRARIATWQETLADKLIESQQALNIVRARLVNAKRILREAQIKAPFDGTIANMHEFNEGSVVIPGTALGELIPHARHVYAQVNVLLQDIELLSPELEASVQLGTTLQSQERSVAAKITSIAAERSQSENASPYFVVQLELLDHAKIPENLIRNGVPVSANIRTEERSIANYLISPILRSANTAMREY